MYNIFKFNNEQISEKNYNKFKFNIGMDYEGDNIKIDLEHKIVNDDYSVIDIIEQSGYYFDNLAPWATMYNLSNYLLKDYTFYIDDKTAVEYENATEIQKAIYDTKDMVTDSTKSIVYNSAMFNLLTPFFQYDSTSIRFDYLILDDYGVTLDWGFSQPEFISKQIDQLFYNGFSDMIKELSDFEFFGKHFPDFIFTYTSPATFRVFENIVLELEFDLRISENHL